MTGIGGSVRVTSSACCRELQGIAMEGEPVMQHLLNIHFYAPSLWEHVRERPAMLYFVFSADVIAVLVAHDLHRGEMVAQVEPRLSSALMLTLQQLLLRHACCPGVLSRAAGMALHGCAHQGLSSFDDRSLG